MIAAQAVPLRDLLNLGRFQPAAVQREYQWTGVEALRLLDDLVRAFETADLLTPVPRGGRAASARTEGVGPVSGASGLDAPLGDGPAPGAPLEGAIDHTALAAARRRSAASRAPEYYFLGPIVVLKAPIAPDLYYVYDGVQRIETLLILLTCLRDSWSDQASLARSELEQALRASDGQARLEAPSPAGSLATLLGRAHGATVRWRPTARFAPADRRLRDVRRLLFERVRDWSDDRRSAFVALLFDNVFVTTTQIANRSLAYQIFLGANARGLRLEIGDILKGKLVELVDRHAESVQDGEAVARKWAEVRRTAGPDFDAFLEAAEALRYERARREDLGKLLVGEMESEVERPEVAADLAFWVRDVLPWQAQSFARIQMHRRKAEVEGVDALYRRLSFLPWRDWLPVAIALDQVVTPDSRHIALHALYCAAYRCDLLNLGDGERFTRFNAALNDLSAGRDPFAPGAEPGALAARVSESDAAAAALLGPFEEGARRDALVKLAETLLWPDSTPRGCTEDMEVHAVLPRVATTAWAGLFPPQEHDYWHVRLGNFCMVAGADHLRVEHADWGEKAALFAEIGARSRSAGRSAAIGAIHGGAWTPVAVRDATLQAARMIAQDLNLPEPSWPERSAHPHHEGRGQAA